MWWAPTCDRSPTVSSRSSRGRRALNGAVDEVNPGRTGFKYRRAVHPLFYGTLKRGHANHNLFCKGYLSVEEATARGRLYDLPSGYPALVVPQENIRAIGTEDPIHDASAVRGCTVRTLHRFPVNSLSSTIRKRGSRRWTVSRVSEGFVPGRPSLYRRVLILAETAGGAGVLAWAYVIEESSGTYLPGGRWPS